MRLSLFSTAAMVTLSCLLSEGSHTMVNAVQIKTATEAQTYQDAFINSLTQTDAEALANLETMSGAELEAQLTSMIQTYVASEVEAQVQFLSTIKSFFSKYVLPVIYVLIALVGLNALNPWVTSFIRDWHRSYPGSCMYPNYYSRPTAAAQTGSSTWLDAVREQGVDLS